MQYLQADGFRFIQTKGASIHQIGERYGNMVLCQYQMSVHQIGFGFITAKGEKLGKNFLRAHFRQ